MLNKAQVSVHLILVSRVFSLILCFIIRLLSLPLLPPLQTAELVSISILPSSEPLYDTLLRHVTEYAVVERVPLAIQLCIHGKLSNIHLTVNWDFGHVSQ